MTTGRTARDLSGLEAVLSEFVSVGFPSGFSLAVVDAEGPLFSAYGGLACRVGTKRPVTEHTSYDLASLTKVVCSVTLMLLFAQRGSLSL